MNDRTAKMLEDQDDLVYDAKGRWHFNENGQTDGKWHLNLFGPEDTPYEGYQWGVSVAFPAGYPGTAPDVKFETSIYHPSVDAKDGTICMRMLGAGWSRTLGIKNVLAQLLHVLANPSPIKPLNDEAGSALQEGVKVFAAAVQQSIRDHDVEEVEEVDSDDDEGLDESESDYE